MDGVLDLVGWISLGIMVMVTGDNGLQSINHVFVASFFMQDTIHKNISYYFFMIIIIILKQGTDIGDFSEMTILPKRLQQNTPPMSKNLLSSKIIRMKS